MNRSLIFTVMLMPAVVASADWPRFRGPNGAGISDATAVPTSWTDADYTWTLDLPGEGHGSPVVVGDRLFLLAGDRTTAERTVLCIAARNGEVRWRRGFESTPYALHRDNNYASSTPAADARGVVAAWTTPDSFKLVALGNDGDELWQRDFGEYKSAWGGAPCPIIVDDLVVILNDQMDPQVMAAYLPKDFEITGPGESYAIAVDRATGRTRWKVDRRTIIAGYSTPCVRPVDDGTKEIVFFGTGSGMTGVDAATGRINWELKDALRSRTVMSPVLAGDLIIGSCGRAIVGDKLVAVRPPGPQNRNAKVVFEIRRSIPLVPTAVYKDGLLFMTCETGIISCVDATNGKEVWRERTRGRFYASPVCIGDRLFCVDRGGNVLVLSASDKFEQLASNSLGEACFATPAVAHGAIYFRTASKLLAVSGERQP